MLVLSRKLKQEILIGDNVKITVLKVKGNTVRLGIEAPREIHVVRGELPKFGDASTGSEADQPSETNAEFTVVFSNSDENQLPSVDVIPFEAGSQTGSPGNTPNNQSLTNRSNLDSIQSIQFQDRLPKPLQHNRLREMVNQLTSKSPS